jgi:hypothetical protein
VEDPPVRVHHIRLALPYEFGEGAHHSRIGDGRVKGTFWICGNAVKKTSPSCNPMNTNVLVHFGAGATGSGQTDDLDVVTAANEFMC